MYAKESLSISAAKVRLLEEKELHISDKNLYF